MSIGNEYLKVIQERFKSVKALGDQTIQQIPAADIHWAYHESSNSTAVIVKHLSGNMMSRWTDFLESDGEKNTRKRDQEFIDDLPTKRAMISTWEKGWETLFTAIDQLNEQDLLKDVFIRGEAHTVIEALERQLSHYSYHIGQIVYIGKQIKGNDWDSLSIPKGKSEEYLRQMLEKNRKL